MKLTRHESKKLPRRKGKSLDFNALSLTVADPTRSSQTYCPNIAGIAGFRFSSIDDTPYFYLYVILDIFSRRVVGWCVADAETATLFQPLFDDAIGKHNVPPGQLTLHADRGAPMKAKATAFLLADLGVTRSHNRPHTSNDNPFSESHFKTLKYQPRFPKRFGCIEDARTFCRQFFDWYNQDHHHSGIGLMTPDQVHYGQIDAVHAARQVTLDQAFRENPGRFVKKAPIPPAKPTAAWINPPTSKKTA